MKPEVRIIAWDDCAFGFSDRHVRLIGVVFRGGSFMDGMLSVVIEKDGTDATGKIADAIINSRNYDQLSVIMLDGISYGGLNIVDIKSLGRKTKLPVIAVMRKKPDINKFLAAMKRLPGFANRRSCVASAGKLYKHAEKLYFQKSGFAVGECNELLELTCTRANIPEPLRVAHIIASGLSGESRGRA